MTSSGKLINKFTGKHTSQIFDVKFDVSRIVRYVAELTTFFPATYLQNSTSHDHNIVVLDFSHGLDASVFV